MSSMTVASMCFQCSFYNSIEVRLKNY